MSFNLLYFRSIGILCVVFFCFFFFFFLIIDCFTLLFAILRWFFFGFLQFSSYFQNRWTEETKRKNSTSNEPKSGPKEVNHYDFVVRFLFGCYIDLYSLVHLIFAVYCCILPLLNSFVFELIFPCLLFVRVLFVVTLSPFSLHSNRFIHDSHT